MARINEAIIACASALSKRTNVSTVSIHSKVTKLNMLFTKRIKEGILNVFQKSYNKWRVENSGPASDKSKIHVVRVMQDALRTSYFRIDTSCEVEKRFKFSTIVNQGWD